MRRRLGSFRPRPGGSTSGVAAGVGLVLLFAVTLLLCVLAVRHVHQRPQTGADVRLSSDPGSQPNTPARVDALQGKDQVNALFLGDALTSGVGASDDAHRYANLLVDALAPSQVAVTGPQIALSRTKALQRAASQGAPYDLVVLELGTDAVGNVRLSAFDLRYDALVTAVRDASPDAALVCVGSWTTKESATPYDAEIQRRCETAGGYFVTIAGLYDRPDSRGPEGRTALVDRAGTNGTVDGLTPNDTGYAQIADRIELALGLVAPAGS